VERALQIDPRSQHPGGMLTEALDKAIAAAAQALCLCPETVRRVVEEGAEG
jgi:plasmid maintenance system antidote protein VapI